MAIGWALLGTGRHSNANVAPQMGHAQDVRRVALYSRDAAKGEAFAAQHGFERVYTSLDDLLKDSEVDAVYDATPDGLHGPNAVRIAQAGKHVLAEKPLAVSVEQCRQAIAACRENGVKLGVVFQQRHEPIHQEIRRLVQAGDLGDVLYVKGHRVRGPAAPGARPQPAPSNVVNWRADPEMKPGGIVMGIGDHVYDMLSYLAMQNIVEVAAFTNSTQQGTPNETHATVLLKFDGGAYGVMLASMRTPYAQEPIAIHGSTASLMCYNSLGVAASPWEQETTPKLYLAGTEGTKSQLFEPTEAIARDIEQFNRCISGDGEPMTSGYEGLVNQAVTEAIYESARTGRAVRVEEFLPLS